jgi:beta-galactosidase/evolved beta-galactosidase subunit alpha
VQSGSLRVPAIAARQKQDLTLPYTLTQTPVAGVEYWLNLSYTLAEATCWAPTGHEVATAQFLLPVPPARAAARRRPAAGTLTLAETPTQVRIAGRGFHVVFDTVRGRIAEWVVGGAALLTEGPRANLWRAPIDNECYGPNRRGYWEGGGLRWIQHRTDAVDCRRATRDTVEVRIRTLASGPTADRRMYCDYRYTLRGDGTIDIAWHGRPDNWWSPAPRIGLAMKLPRRYGQVTWYGRGPGESYPDSALAGRIDVFACDVDALTTHYVKPQENGNRMDTRWVLFADRGGRGVLAAGQPTLNFSAHRYSLENLTDVGHDRELVFGDEINVNLDYRQRGVGSAACGPDVLPAEELTPHEFTFRVQLMPYDKRAGTPAEQVRGLTGE